MIGAICMEDDTEDAPAYMDLTHTIIGYIETTAGPIAQVATKLSVKDYCHDWQARWSMKRDRFRIPTGLYAIGNPGEDSAVLVTANYKLTFDKLRIELGGLDLWILVIDTKGINVWCSAGKGTFSAPEIIYRAKQSGLAKIVSHRKLVLPQLAGPGVVAHAVTKATGFKVLYGPIRAADIPAYIANGYKATADMRRISFNWVERIVLTPVELMMSSKYLPIIIIVLFFINIINKGGMSWVELLKLTGYNSLPYIIAILIGSFLVPVMLPLLPFRSFALKGAVAGIIWSGAVIGLGDIFMYRNQLTVMLGNSLILTALISFQALNFTGSTPYTSFSGTQKETLQSVPIMLAAALAGLVLLIVARFVAI